MRLGGRSRDLPSAWAIAAALLAPAACGPDASERMLSPQHRLIDLAHPGVPVSRLPVATLQDDTRYAIRSFGEAFETPAVTIAPESRLEFGLGVHPAAREQGPVAFRVDACEAGDCREIFAETVDPAAAAASGWQQR